MIFLGGRGELYRVKLYNLKYEFFKKSLRKERRPHHFIGVQAMLARRVFGFCFGGLF